MLLRRYTETRRRHPLAPGGPFGTRVQDGIARETLLMAPLREAADLLVDTTDVPLPELRRRMEARFRPEGAPGLSITVQSFGFPKGLPREADLVFDMRFLRNPITCRRSSHSPVATPEWLNMSPRMLPFPPSGRI